MKSLPKLADSSTFPSRMRTARHAPHEPLPVICSERRYVPSAANILGTGAWFIALRPPLTQSRACPAARTIIDRALPA